MPVLSVRLSNLQRLHFYSPIWFLLVDYYRRAGKSHRPKSRAVRLHLLADFRSAQYLLQIKNAPNSFHVKKYPACCDHVAYGK
jgi:hypothetical protein